MNRQLNGWKYLLAVAALASIVVITGCSHESILAPDSGQETSLNRSLPVELYTAVSVSQDISASDGGVIAISKDGYNHAFIVAKDGLDADATISAKVESEYINGKKAVVFEFGPDGLVFNEASKLEFDIGAINVKATSAYLYYFDPKVGEWVLQSAQRVDKGLVTFDINHFSKYAISD